MDAKVFKHKDFSPLAKQLNLVMVYIDFPSNKKLVPKKYRKRNNNLSSKYQVKGYPTYIVLDSKLNKLGKLGAGQNKICQSFINEIQDLTRLSSKAIEKKAMELGNKANEYLEV